MSSYIAAFPLCWPEGWPRATKRKNGPFRQSVYTAVQNLTEELRIMGARDVIVSTSIPLRRDGIPLSKPPVDGDHGAAVYFHRKGNSLCLACDQYYLVEDNLQALAKSVEALRGLERWGSTDLLDRAFTGFAALPAGPHWSTLLAVSRNADRETIDNAYKLLVRSLHPDAGGSHEDMVALNAAYEAAIAEVEK